MSRLTRNQKQLRRVRAQFYGTRSRVHARLAEAADLRVSPLYRGIRWLTAAAALLLLVELVTGIFLSLYYYPAPDAAYDSTRFLNERVTSGWLVRSIHTWAGEILLVVVVVHVAAVYFRRAFEHPRQYEWIVGALLLPAVLAFRFTGRLLPWDTIGYAVTHRGLALIESIPLLGRFATTWLRGGEELGPNTLSRFFTTHTLILPWLVVLILYGHLALLRRYGLKKPTTKEDES